MSRRIHRALAWFALAAIAFNALASTAATFVASPPALQWICAADGVPGPKPGLPSHPAKGLAHCPLCTGPLDHVAPVASSFEFLAADFGSSRRTPVPGLDAFARPAIRLPPSHAPPQHS